MTPPAAFQEYKLYNQKLEGMGSVCLPCDPHPPILIEWRHQFFMRPVGAERFILISCYFVPLRDQYPALHPQADAPQT